MKLKIWLWLSCLCVLTTLSVCISVYAYNVYATKSVSTNMVIMSGNSNNSNLDDGLHDCVCSSRHLQWVV